MNAIAIETFCVGERTEAETHMPKEQLKTFVIRLTSQWESALSRSQIMKQASSKIKYTVSLCTLGFVCVQSRSKLETGKEKSTPALSFICSQCH